MSFGPSARQIVRNVYDEDKKVIKVSNTGVVNPLAKYVEATYSNGNKTVTLVYYESSSKVTTYNTIVETHKVAVDTSFTSAEWT